MLRHRCVFVHIPKSAGMSIALSLFGNLAAGHLTLREYRRLFIDVLGVENFSEYFKFTFVRNPWARVVSAYAFLKRGGINALDRTRAAESVDQYASFGEFVREWLTSDNISRELHLHFRPQRCFLLDDDDLVGMDFVGRVETIERDFRIVTERLGIDASLRHENVNVHDDYRRYFDDQTADIVQRLYAMDVRTFGYRFDPAP